MEEDGGSMKSVDSLMTPDAINKLAASAGLRVMRDTQSGVIHMFPCMAGQTLNHEVKTLIENAQVQAINAVIDVIRYNWCDSADDMISIIECVKGLKYGFGD